MNHSHSIRVFTVFLFGIILCTASTQALAGGKKVTVLLNDSSSFTGELLAVHSANVILCRDPWLSEEKLAAHPDSLTVVHLSDVRSIAVPGHSNAYLGAGIGAAAGMGIGAIVGYHSSTPLPGAEYQRGLNAEVGAFLGILPGAFIGLIVGNVIRTGDRTVDPSDSTQMNSLSDEARYQTAEPEFIKRIDAK